MDRISRAKRHSVEFFKISPNDQKNIWSGEHFRNLGRQMLQLTTGRTLYLSQMTQKRRACQLFSSARIFGIGWALIKRDDILEFGRRESNTPPRIVLPVEQCIVIMIYIKWLLGDKLDIRTRTLSTCQRHRRYLFTIKAIVAFLWDSFDCPLLVNIPITDQTGRSDVMFIRVGSSSFFLSSIFVAFFTNANLIPSALMSWVFFLYKAHE